MYNLIVAAQDATSGQEQEPAVFTGVLTGNGAPEEHRAGVHREVRKFSERAVVEDARGIGEEQ